VRDLDSIGIRLVEIEAQSPGMGIGFRHRLSRPYDRPDS
jgi:hypothetical protein